MMRGLIFAALAAGLTVLSSNGFAETNFPTKPIRLVVPYAPGGPADVAARLLAEEMSGGIGQRVIVENKPGAGGVLAESDIAFGPKDGYNILLVTPTFAIAPLTMQQPYELTDFTPISLFVSQPYAMLVNADAPYETVGEFVEYARARPGELNFAGSSPTGGAALVARRFAALADIEMVGVQYDGQGPSQIAVMADEVQLLFDTPLTAIPLHRDGRARILGMTSQDRLPSADDIPTVQEQGVPLVTTTWYGIFTAAGTPEPVIEKLNAEIRNAVASPSFQARIAATGAVAEAGSPEELLQLVNETQETYRGILEEIQVNP